MIANLIDLIAPACAALDLDPLANGLQLIAAHSLSAPAAPVHQPSTRAWAETQGVGAYTPARVPFPLLATRPALVCRFAGAASTAQTLRALLERYPAHHPLVLVRVAGGHAQTWSAPLFALAEQPLDELTCVYLPPLAPLDDLRGDGPQTVVTRLLGPGGCPWDVKQTHHSLRQALLEETHEVLEALDAGDMDALADELGDLLLQVLFHSEIARQAGHFALGDVYANITAKLIRRHPHIFGTASVIDAGEVLQNWDAIKQAERAAKGQAPRPSALDGIPPALPALAAGQKLIRKATKAGFDYDNASGAWAKLREEVAELEDAVEHEAHADDATRMQRIAEEFGDLLLALTKLANWLDVDAESALRAASAKFRRRYTRMEQQISVAGHDLKMLSIPAKEAAWRQAKADE